MDHASEEFGIPVLEGTSQELSATSAHDFLRRKEKVTALPPINPVGGTVFLYYNPGKEGDWKADGYRWYQNGRKHLPSSNPVVTKTYYVLLVEGEIGPVKNKEFRKVAHHLADDPKGVEGTLIQYLGTVPEKGVLYPHGNAKKSSPHIRTAPSMLKEAGETYKDPSVHYKEKVCSSSVPATHEATLKPRNPRQVKNAQAQARKGRRYTQDDLFNLVELTYDIQDYTHRMFLVPELGVVLGHRAMLQEFRAVLCTKGQQPQLVSYDTTYNLGDFYVSPLLFRHTLFEGAPVMPVAFLIHEKRTQFAHEVFMDFIAKEVPEIAGVPFVTDGEENIITAITKRLPQVRQLRCWNHLQSGARHWLRKHGASSSECSVYVQDLKQLLMSPTEKDYRHLYGTLSQKWGQAFVEYYNHHIDPEVTASAGRWILEPLGIYNGYSGVTTNQSEGFNTLLKTFTLRKENTIDSLMLALYFLQCYFSNEIQRGLAGLGQYCLLAPFKSLGIPAHEMNLQHCYAPEEIAERMMEQRKHGSLNVTALKHEATDQGTNESNLTDGEDENDNDRQTQTEEVPSATAHAENPIPSQMDRAQLVLQNKNCSYQADLKTFVVQGTSCAHAVKLFPQASCTCPAKKECYHILAAKLYMGIEVKNKRKRITMTQLRRNLRPKSSKRKGRKGPLQEDEVEPAPDAKVHNCQLAESPTVVAPTSPSKPSCDFSSRKESPTLVTPTSPSKPSCDFSGSKESCTLEAPVSPAKSTKLMDLTNSLQLRHTNIAKNWMQELHFEERHIEMILNGEKLDDRVIHASQSLMKRMFPKQTGLRDTVVLGGAERWDDKPDGFIQIVFDQSRLHWICVSNKFSEDGVVEIFDTAPPRLQQVPACVQRAIAVIMKSQGDTIRVRFVNVQKQAGAKDCGLYAIAIVLSLAMGVDLCTREYKQECLRSELFSSLERGEMKPFSSKKVKRRWRNGKVTHIKIYCKCRGIEDGPMIECEECKEWFHKECCDVSEVFFSKSEDLQWTCMDCYGKHMRHTLLC